MAKKTINVVYKVDDSELLKVKARIQETEKATKQAETAMTSLGTKTQQTGIVISKTYEGQMLQMQRLRAQIDLTNQSDTARLTKLKADYGQVKQKVDEFNKSLQESSKSGESNLNIFNSLKGTLAALFSIAAVKQIGAFVVEMNKLAGEVEGVDRAFKRAFPNAEIVLNRLQKSTHGAVTDFDLMKRTLQATNLGVNVEHLGVLFEFAAVRAQQTGESVDYLVDSIVRGIGRKSILVLDNLGLSATRLREQFAGASIASKSVGEVTEGVAAIAKVELAKMGGYIETTETNVKQLNVSWEALKLNIAQTLQSSGFIKALDEIVDGFRRLNMSIEEVDKETSDLLAADSVNAFLESGVRTVNQIEEEVNRRSQNKIAIQNELAEKKKSFFANQQAIRDLEIRNDAEAQAIVLLQKYAAQLAKNANPQKIEVGFIQDIKDAISALNEEIDAASRERLPGLQAKLDVLQRQLKIAQLLRPIGSADDTNKKNDLKELESDAKAEAQILQDANEFIEKSEEDFDKKLEAGQKEFWGNIKKIDEAGAEELRDENDRARAAELKAFEKNKKDKERLEKEFQMFLFESAGRILEFSLINRRDEKEEINDFYDEQIKLAGNNESAKKQIEDKRKKELDQERIRQQEADKQDAITKIEIDTAVAVMKTLAEYGFTPVGIGFAALAAAAGLIQIATVRSVKSGSLKTRAFKEGEVGIDGPGTSTSDSIFARLSKGESVINAQATSQSRALLEAINERRIDDSILNKIAGDGGRSVNVFDDRGIIDAIEKNKEDYAVHGATIMKGIQKGKNFKLYIRSKVQGY